MSGAAGKLPVWERLRAPDSRRLEVLPVEHISRPRVRVVDGDLPEVEDATVFDAWRTADGVRLRAARVRDNVVTPYLVDAGELSIEASDGRLEALIGGSGRVAAAGDLERLACACRGISVDAVYRAIGSGWSSAEAVKRTTRLAFGVCQGRRCVPWLAARLELSADDPRAQVRPRPPLVPVPASVLAAFASGD